MSVTVTDIEVRLGRKIADEEKPRVQAFIVDASALVADYCGSGYREDHPGIKAVVCAEVVRWLVVSPGIVSERVGEVEVEFGSSAVAQALSPAARAALKRFRRKMASVTLLVDTPTMIWPPSPCGRPAPAGGDVPAGSPDVQGRKDPPPVQGPQGDPPQPAAAGVS